MALVFIAIGAFDIAPFVDWIDEKDLPMTLKSAVMIGLLGGIPAVIIGITVVGDTFWGKRSR